MASPALQAEYLKAGEDYLAALTKLGMRPVFLGWGWEVATEQWLLVLVTSIVEAGGPLALNKLLFKAYNAEATPKAISPFIVRVFAPEVANSGGLIMVAPGSFVSSIKDKYGRPKKHTDDDGNPIKIVRATQNFFGIEMNSDYAYETLMPASVKYHDRRHEWQKFRKNVERLAA